MTAAGRAMASRWMSSDRTAAAHGDTVLEVMAELESARGVRARLEVLEHQHLTTLHDAIQQAFGWGDDHLYSFWLDGGYFTGVQSEITTPATPDHVRRRPTSRSPSSISSSGGASATSSTSAMSGASR